MSIESPNNPRSARQLMKKWRDKPPPNESRVLTKHAIKVAGNAAKLGKLLGISRSSVYQWMPPYRSSPYMPKLMADRLLSDPVIKEELHKLEREEIHTLLVK